MSIPTFLATETLRFHVLEKGEVQWGWGCAGAQSEGVGRDPSFLWSLHKLERGSYTWQG